MTGHVVLVTDEAKSGYKAIEITLKGFADMEWSEKGSNENSVTFQSHEDYIVNTAVLWRPPGGKIESGSYQFPFSLKFQAN